MPSRLKSLELHGYKTFANRALFEFASTVTAIVGPNGSGKSNISDSLRWVLGEQSYSLLRGKKTEDMIFSGSESRPRAGMASATVTFDNSDGWLPIDFTEVAITRRAYRDGQNEYLINGQRVRLRDVGELLSQSGLAERTYTVIGQGLVDAVLSLRAEERRRLFEEAAGIGLHRSRREDALRRMEITHRNLERVQDILAELQPRLHSLERQARRAQEYEQVRTDLQVLLREWYGYHWHNSQHELTEAQTTARLQEAKLEEARQVQARGDGNLAELRKHIANLRADLNGWHLTLAGLHTRREALSRELAVSEERERSLEIQREAIQTELLNSRQEEAFQQEQLSIASIEDERFTQELIEARSSNEAARLALQERQAERVKVEADLQAGRRLTAELNSNQGRAFARQSERQAQASRAQKALESTAQALSKAEKDFQLEQARLQAAQQGEEAANHAQKEAEKLWQAQQRRIEDSELGRKQTLEKLSDLQTELARFTARLDVLDQAEASLTGYASGTRLLLQAARQSRLTGSRGALSNFLEVPPELERAIVAALGEYLDAVILEADPDQALDLLQAQAGHGVLLPLERLISEPLKVESPGFEGDLLGVAADLVKAPAEVRPAVDLLLGQVLVVRDRQAARQVLQGQSAGVRAVTLYGEVFHATGQVHAIAGNDTGGDQTLLSRSRERRELAGHRARLEAQIDQLNQLLAKQAEEVQDLHAQGARLERSNLEVRKILEKAGKEVSQVRLALEQAERQVHWQEEQRLRLVDEIKQGEAESGQIASELAALENRLTQSRQVLREQNAALESLSLDEFQSQLAHWNTRAAVAERALADAQERSEERLAAIDRLRRSQQVLQSRFESMKDASQALASTRVSQRQEETDVTTQINSLQAQIDPSEAELRDLEAEQVVLEKAGAGARQIVSAAEHYHAQTRITLARRQEALETLRRRIEDDFGLVAFEYDAQVSGPTPLPLAGMVEQLPKVSQLSAEIEEAIKRQRAQLRRMGAINPEAQTEYLEVQERFGFLTGQVADLHKAEEDVRQIINELDILMQREFHRTYDAVAAEFRDIFTRLFGGGSARLTLTDPDNLTETGIDIEARLPGRRMQSLALLSGGERSLTATALIFALLKVSPTPFCILDEVDAMLDEANVGRFRELLRELSQNTQFLIITHNRNTVQVADVIYGVTMGRDSVSQVLSLKLDEISQVVEG